MEWLQDELAETSAHKLKAGMLGRITPAPLWFPGLLTEVSALWSFRFVSHGGTPGHLWL